MCWEVLFLGVPLGGGRKGKTKKGWVEIDQYALGIRGHFEVKKTQKFGEL